jgi:hypothetical protein
VARRNYTVGFFFLLASHLLLTQAAHAVVIDGSIAGDSYGAPLSLQYTNTGFGNNDGANKGSELDGAYARIDNGILYLGFTGNLEDNFNKLVVFFDSKAGGQNQLQGDVNSGGNNPVVDPSPFPSDPGMFQKMTAYAPTTFDTGFTADYALVLRNGFTGSENRFDVDYAVIGGGTSQYLGVFDPTHSNFGATGTGANGHPINIGFDNSNTAGVTGDGPFETPTAGNPQDVATGIELAISLADLGGPAINSQIKVTAFINNSNHDYLSNQFLGAGLLDVNLGSNELGGYIPGASFFNLNDYSGDQFFLINAIPETSAGLMVGASLGISGIAAALFRISRNLGSKPTRLSPTSLSCSD